MSKPKATDTLLSKIKAAAKRRAKTTDQPYNAELEHVAREHGFNSWYEVTQLNKGARPGSVGEEFPVDPQLPPKFNSTPNEALSEEEIARWWLRPFAVSLEDGGYAVYCLDGGAWDRATDYGSAADLPAARVLAAAKLEKSRAYEDMPIIWPAADGGYLVTVGSLHPKLPRAILFDCSNRAEAQRWIDGWESLCATEPQDAKARLASARERARTEAEGL